MESSQLTRYTLWQPGGCVESPAGLAVRRAPPDWLGTMVNTGEPFGGMS